MLYTYIMSKNSTNTHTPGCLAHTRGLQALRRSIDNVAAHADISEKAIERYLVEQARQNGLPCLKYSNPNMVGYPDRLLVLRGGSVVWVELKSRGRKPTKIQQMRVAELTAMGHSVRVIDNKADIDELIKIARR